jgi:replicative DNA helicase
MPRLDKALDGGFYGGRFYGFAARQKKGKSAMLASFAYSIAERGGRVAYITLEMDAKEVAQRFLSRASGLRPSIFRNAKNIANFSPKLNQAREYLSKTNLGIISAPRMTLDKLRLTMTGLGYGKAADVVIVDYLQLVTGQEKGQNSAEHLDNVAQTMAEMAKVHGFSVITAVQLNRDDMVRGGDGLLNACDMAFKLDTSAVRRADGTDAVEAWLEMLATRYTAYCDIGSKEQPAYDLIDEGPYYAER